MPSESDPTPRSLREAQAAATRTAILNAAEALFAEKGYAGTSMRAVARDARTSQPLLHHHFGSKQGLYDAVKERFTARYEALQTPEVKAGQLDLSFVHEVMLGYLRYLESHPRAHRLRQWAQLEGDHRPWGDEDGVWQRMHAAVVAGQQAGLLDDTLDPALFLASAAGAVTYWFESKALVCRALSLETTDPELDRRYVEQTIRTLLLGCATPTLQDMWGLQPPI